MRRMRPIVLLASLLLALLLGSHPAAASPPEGFVRTGSGTPVSFVHRPRHGSQARQLLRATPPILQRIQEDLGVSGPLGVEVWIAQNPADLRALAPRDPPPPPGALGVAYPARRLIVLSLSAGAQVLPMSLEALYTHELSHVALSEAVGGNRVPRWFTEGVAIRHS